MILWVILAWDGTAGMRIRLDQGVSEDCLILYYAITSPLLLAAPIH